MLDDANAAVAAAARTGMIANRANAHLTRAELLAATGDARAAAHDVRRALTLYNAKANVVAAAATQAQFAQLLAGAPQASGR